MIYCHIFIPQSLCIYRYQATVRRAAKMSGGATRVSDGHGCRDTGLLSPQSRPWDGILPQPWQTGQKYLGKT